MSLNGSRYGARQAAPVIRCSRAAVWARLMDCWPRQVPSEYPVMILDWAPQVTAR